MALEFNTLTTCPFCGVAKTRLWWQGKAITGIKHPRIEQDDTCRGVKSVDPSHHRHCLVTDYQRLAEHLGNTAYAKRKQMMVRAASDFGFDLPTE